ncbi:MAG: N,N-dimethylformamidase beta subunit family domain-containing protein, partial [Burkholderiales bacterium]
TRYKGFLSVGHDEYWTKQMRDAVESARDLGVNLGFFGANTGYWQIRLDPSIATTGGNQPYRTIVAYKDAALDPLAGSNPAEATTQFRLAPVNRPEAALVGVMYDYSPVNFQDIVISNCIPWICSGTGLTTGSHLAGMLGYEVDKTDLVYSPANIQAISASPYNVTVNGVPETRYSNMTYYQAVSGAGVFATGSMNWNYGLNTFGTNPAPENPAVQQITRNVLNSFVPAPPQAQAAGNASVSALQIDNISTSTSGGGCAFRGNGQDRLDISLLMLLAVNMLWQWRRKCRQN